MISKNIFTALIIFILSVNVLYSQITIGVALPLMNNSSNPEDKKLGEQMLKGINDAIDDYNSAHSDNKVSLEILDTKKDPATTLTIINKFGSDSSVIAIFGPVFSNELVSGAGAAAFHRIPIVTPTATQDFLAENNEYVFQLNPTYEIRGKSIADFAMKELKMKNFIILAEENYGIHFAKPFQEEVENNGNNVLSVTYYSKDNADLSQKLAEIKNQISINEKLLDFGKLTKAQIEKLRKIKFHFSNLDSLLNTKLTVSIYKLFGRQAGKVMDSIGIIPLNNTEGNRNYVPGYADAIYIPVSGPDDISLLVKQLNTENINLPILGTSDWNNESVLKDNRMYIKDLFFDSDFFLEDKSKIGTVNLSDQEIKNYYLGYDGLKLILDKISEGNDTREKMNTALEAETNYKAIHNNITIKNRTNHHVSIVNFHNGELKKIKDFVY